MPQTPVGFEVGPPASAAATLEREPSAPTRTSARSVLPSAKWATTDPSAAVSKERNSEEKCSEPSSP